MSESEILLVEVECCVDCHLHNWCSRHNEAKYDDLFNKLYAKAKNISANFHLHKNNLPSNFIRKPIILRTYGPHKYYDEKSGEIAQYPRHGSF